MLHSFKNFYIVTLGYSLKQQNEYSTPDRNSRTLGGDFFDVQVPTLTRRHC